MPPASQWWNSAKSAQVSANPDVTVAGGAMGAVITQWLFNDKGSVIGGTTTLTAYYLVVEASPDDGQTWYRKGLQLLDERWVEASITGNVDNTGGAISAQTTSGYVALGTGRSQLITDIPRGCGREISYRLVVPSGASAAGIIFRLVESSVASVISTTDLSDVVLGVTFTPTLSTDTAATWTGAVVTAEYSRTGRMLDLVFGQIVGSVSGSTAELRLTLPAGFVSAAIVGGPITARNSGAVVNGAWYIGAGATQIRLFPAAMHTGTWAAAAATTGVYMCIRLRIQ